MRLRKGTILRDAKTFCLVNKAFLQEKLVNQSLAWWGVIVALVTRESKHTILANSNLPIKCKWREKKS